MTSQKYDLIEIKPSHDIYFNHNQKREVVFENIEFEFSFLKHNSPEFIFNTLDTNIFFRNVNI